MEHLNTPRMEYIAGLVNVILPGASIEEKRSLFLTLWRQTDEWIAQEIDKAIKRAHGWPIFLPDMRDIKTSGVHGLALNEIRLVRKR